MSNTDKELEMAPAEKLDEKKQIIRKIIVNPDNIIKMKRLSSLYSDEIPEGAKEIDVISFFFNKAFNIFLESGEIERKLQEIKG